MELVFRGVGGAPRPMKRGTIASPWRYDAGTHPVKAGVEAGWTDLTAQAASAEIITTPSAGDGQMKRPRSSRFA
jgi:hypothetical protein